jgi:colicin import membrane protein
MNLAKSLLVVLLFAAIPGFSLAADERSQYIAKVSALIKSNTIFDMSKGEIANDPTIYRITLDEGGYVKSVIKIKSSKVVGFDEAVLGAIERSQPFPKDQNGHVPQVLEFVNHPRSED